MSTTTTETPTDDEMCVYCNSRISDHDPICIRDCTVDRGSPSYFCNDACLSAHIDAAELAIGDACQWAPEDADCC